MAERAVPGPGYWLSRIVLGREESRDDAPYPALRTRYYREPKRRTFEAAKVLVEAGVFGLRPVHVDEERGEIVALRRTPWGTIDVTLTVYALRPFESAVDVLTARRGALGDFGAGYRLIAAMFRALDGRLRPAEPTR
ncbi:hypothetical protein [Hydrogenibacillus sp. N12]|uniref:hypothetical protein n=1 Tax=Hydrogenibacillus sp. N12 TaxID=2866627 RepID=UPI001C7DAACB|nr:hypothetical protein [Hydrogenibacillus sp. N12]QZA32266.1 hypothetical protein K2M58_07980 [Hydrogenibacillus sp. N12]